MLKKSLTVVMLIFILFGVGIGIYFGFFSTAQNDRQNEKNAIFENVQTRQVEVTRFFTYGKYFNFSGKLSGISKDNYESAKLYITDGNGLEKTYQLNGDFQNDELVLSTETTINSGLNLDELDINEYVVLIRIRTNNSVNPKFYSLSNSSECKNIEYYTMTKDNTNNKINIEFKNIKYENKDLKYLAIDVKNTDEVNVYDIVIDAGHGGKDFGEKYGGITEADITLSYAKLLKDKLESKGLKVILTRNDENNENYTSTNMYDENGRITIACASKAKYMISLHLNNGKQGLKGLEIYSPAKCKLDFAQNMANKIVTYTNIEYSNNNSFKKGDGVYVRNFTSNVINEYINTANKKGYEPYNLTLDTPFLYTIREVGGIATNAYVDGRNTSYSANKYYKSNQGIECYQIEMGYIKNDLEIIKTQMEQYVTAICESILDEI